MSLKLSATEAIEEIKRIFFGVEPVAPVAPPAPAAPAPVALETEYTLADGTVVTIDKLEAGGIVSIAGQPAPDGVIELSDGTSITIAAGVIASVEVKAVEPAEPADMNKQFAEDIANLRTEFASHKEAFTQVQTDFAAAKETIGKQDLAISGLLKVVEQLAETPVADPAQAPVDFESMTPLQKFRYQKRN
jgi:hypothetical protein